MCLWKFDTLNSYNESYVWDLHAKLLGVIVIFIQLWKNLCGIYIISGGKKFITICYENSITNYGVFYRYFVA